MMPGGTRDSYLTRGEEIQTLERQLAEARQHVEALLRLVWILTRNGLSAEEAKVSDAAEKWLEATRG
jgi:hypothetical protein